MLPLIRFCAALLALSLAGCSGSGQMAPGTTVGTPVPGGLEYQREVSVRGDDHSYLLFVPTAQIGRSDLPLVVSLHGGGGNAREHDLFTRMRIKAATAGFVLLTPNGYRGTWNAGSCCAPAQTADIDHSAVIRAMLDDAERLVSVDDTRVFALGHSNGGMMAYRLACELSDRIAAIAANSAVMMDRDLDTTPPTQVFSCQPTRPVPILHLHGLADTCVPFAGGPSTGPAGGERPPVSDSIDFWVANNRCTLPPLLPTHVNGDARCETYTGCQDRAVVELCTVDGAGHVWPGTGANPSGETCGGSGTTDLDANDVIWAFFVDHPLS
ncbi:MAG: PHB depolymerase family esterase [Sinimarinibacterium sp.]